jgi:hypothetical protein
MNEYRIKRGRDVSKEKLAYIVEALQNFMYWDEDSGQMFLNPEKAVNGGDLVEFVDGLMSGNGLYPKKRGPKDWSPKDR